MCDLVRAAPGSPFVGYTMVRADQCSPPVGHTLGLTGTWAPDLLTSWAPGLLASWSPVLLAPRLLPRHLGGRSAGHDLASSFSGSGATGARDVAGSLFLGLRRSWALQLPTGNLLGLL